MPVPTNYISGGIWRGLIGLLYWWRDIIRGWRDLERPVQCSYIGEKISRCLFIAVILVEIYYKGWRDLERAVWSFINWRRDIIRGEEMWTGLIGAFILAERYGGSCLELL